MAFLDRFAHEKTRTDELDHVVENLTAILNTKEGYGSVVGRFGIGSYLAKQGSRDSVRTLMNEITEEIALYEPRLTDFELDLIGKNSDLNLVFSIVGKVGARRCKLRMLFNTVFGNFTIEKVAL